MITKELKALEELLTDVSIKCPKAREEVLRAFLDAYQKHKRMHGSYKFLNSQKYEESMAKRLAFQVEEAQKIIDKYR